MSRFIVEFVKTVSGDNGYEREACQFKCDIDAFDKQAAIESAKQRFCEAHDLSDWSSHADRVKASEGDFPS